MDKVTTEEIKRFQNGDTKVFNIIIKSYKQMVTNLCLKYLRNNEEANDMAQEVFINMYSSINKFKFKSSLTTWVYRLTVNSCINKLRYLKKRRNINQTPANLPEEDSKLNIERIADKGILQDEKMELKELREVMMQELEGFDEIDRTVLILLDMEGLSCENISKIIKMPIGSIKSRASRARKKLKNRVLTRIGGVQ